MYMRINHLFLHEHTVRQSLIILLLLFCLYVLLNICWSLKYGLPSRADHVYWSLVGLIWSSQYQYTDTWYTNIFQRLKEEEEEREEEVYLESMMHDEQHAMIVAAYLCVQWRGLMNTCPKLAVLKCFSFIFLIGRAGLPKMGAVSLHKGSHLDGYVSPILYWSGWNGSLCSEVDCYIHSFLEFG